MNEFVYIPGYISFQGVSEEEEDDVDQVLKLKVFLITTYHPARLLNFVYSYFSPKLFKFGTAQNQRVARSVD